MDSESVEQALMQEFSQFQKIYETAVEFLVKYSFQALGAILIFIIGLILARKISNVILKQLEKRNIDVTLRTYAGHIVHLLIVFCFTVIALGKFGISIAPFVAALGAVTLGVGLALQGLVSNYGAGLSIITTRPFKVGDTISVIDVSGVVKEIKLAATIVETEDQEEITIPNKHIIGEVLLNTFEYKLVETSIGIAYDNDPNAAIDAIHAAYKTEDFVCQQPGPQIGVDHFADSAIVVGIRVWVPTKTYTENRYRLNLVALNAVKEAGLNIPFPQLDVHQVN